MSCTLGAVRCGDPVCPGHGVLRTPKVQTSLPNSISGQGRSLRDASAGREGGRKHSLSALPTLAVSALPPTANTH